MSTRKSPTETELACMLEMENHLLQKVDVVQSTTYDGLAELHHLLLRNEVLANLVVFLETATAVGID